MNTIPDAGLPGDTPHASSGTGSGNPQPGQTCFDCGYVLEGLPVDGRCPECGKPVSESLRGILLRYADRNYLSTIHGGLSLYLTGLLFMIAFMVLSVGVGFLFGRRNMGSLTGLGVILQMLGLILSAMMLWGFWKYTEPDPGYLGVENPHSARVLARIGTAGSAGVAVLNIILALLGVRGGFKFPVGGGSALDPLAILSILAGLAGLVFWCLQFFAGMRYTAWLARRIPDAQVEKRCKTYLWLLPVLFVPGMVLCGLGPLVALILYWILLDKVRKALKASLASSA